MRTDELDRFLSRVSRHGGICFPTRVKVYAPTCNDRCIGAVEKLYRRMTSMFGGATVYRSAVGTWADPSTGRVEEEPVWVIEVAHNCLSDTQAQEFADALLEYAREADQKYIAVAQGAFYVLPTEELGRRVRK